MKEKIKVIQHKVFTYCGVISLFLAVILVIIAFGIHFGVNSIIDHGVREKLILNKDNLEEWQTNTNNNVEWYDNAFIWNLTNPDEVLSGLTPQYESLPIVSYRRYFQRYNITLSRDENTVSFLQQTYYIHQEEKSKQPLDEYVYNINPGYVAVLQAMGGERNLMRAMAGGAINTILESLEVTFTRVFLHTFIKLMSSPSLTQMFQSCFTALGNDWEIFHNVWTGTTKSNITQCEYFQISLFEDRTPSFSAEVTRKLFDADVPFSILDDIPDNYALWVLANFPSVKENYTTAINTLQNKLDIAKEDVEIISKWIVEFDYFVAYPRFKSFVPGIKVVTDIGYLQWCSDEAKGESVTTGLLKQYLPGVPEFYFYQTSVLKKENPIVFDFQRIKHILNSTDDGNAPLLEQENMAKFLDLVESGKYEEIKERWTFTKDEAIIFYNYTIYVVEIFVKDTLVKFYKNYNGLISKRTVDEWLFNYEDPFLSLLGQGDLSKKNHIMQNETKEEVLKNQNLHIMYTGKYNISWVREFQQYDGVQTMEFWNKTACPEGVPIRGTTGEQFRPYLTDNNETMVTVWFPQLMRPQNFTPHGRITKKGISLIRFKLQEGMIDVGTEGKGRGQIFNNHFRAMANLTQMGAPIFISNWKFVQSGSFFRDVLGGIGEPNPEDETILDIEPTTGATMNEDKRIQANVYLGNETEFRGPNVKAWLRGGTEYFSNVPTGIVYPLALLQETATIPDNLADTFKATVYKAQNIKTIVMWTSIALSILAGLVGAICLLIAFRLKNPEE